jgi:hypothetical protein
MKGQMSALFVSLLILMAPTTTVLAQQTPGKGESQTKVAATTVEITNNNWANVHVYLDRDGFLSPLGYVDSFKTEEFRLPKSAEMAGLDLRLLVVPLASLNVYVSPQLIFAPGDQIRLNVEESLNLSNVSVLPGGADQGGDHAGGQAQDQVRVPVPVPQVPASTTWS